MKWFAVILVALSLLSAPNRLTAQGLGNATKVFTAPSAMSGVEAQDTSEQARTWQAALVRVPGAAGKSKRVAMADLADHMVGRTTELPVIIFMHGCSGVWAGTRQRIKFFADNGYLVIAPASFARVKYPKSCAPLQHRSGIYRPTLALRLADARHAIQKAMQFSFVDRNAIVLAGFSQGGVVAARFKSDAKTKLAARVIEGWTCHSAWREYDGMIAPESEPVLAMVGELDPWFQNPWNSGDCKVHLHQGNGSRSVVFEDPPLHRKHGLLKFDAPQQVVLGFLSKVLR